MSKMIHILPNDDHTLLIELDNHHKIVFDMKTRLQSARFCKLADIERFKAVSIEYGNTLVWDSLCQITISEIINSIER